MSLIKPWRISRPQDINSHTEPLKQDFSTIPPGDKWIQLIRHHIFFPFNLRQLKMEHCYWAGTSSSFMDFVYYVLEFIQIHHKKVSRNKMRKRVYEQPQAKMNSTLPLFLKKNSSHLPPNWWKNSFFPSPLFSLPHHRFPFKASDSTPQQGKQSRLKFIPNRMGEC